MSCDVGTISQPYLLQRLTLATRDLAKLQIYDLSDHFCTRVSIQHLCCIRLVGKIDLTMSSILDAKPD